MDYPSAGLSLATIADWDTWTPSSRPSTLKGGNELLVEQTDCTVEAFSCQRRLGSRITEILVEEGRKVKKRRLFNIHNSREDTQYHKDKKPEWCGGIVGCRARRRLLEALDFQLLREKVGGHLCTKVMFRSSKTKGSLQSWLGKVVDGTCPRGKADVPDRSAAVNTDRQQRGQIG